jgi:hypothetical protein
MNLLNFKEKSVRFLRKVKSEQSKYRGGLPLLFVQLPSRNVVFVGLQDLLIGGGCEF